MSIIFPESLLLGYILPAKISLFEVKVSVEGGLPWLMVHHSWLISKTGCTQS